MLNPSTADAMKDDPTIRKCIGFAKQWGYGGITVVNLFPLRATDPRELFTWEDESADRDNYETIHAALAEHPVRIAAWGAHRIEPEREARMRTILGPDARCLGKTKAGHPRHPLYVPYTQPLVPLATATPAAPETGGTRDEGR
jgi:hypothetical protein